MRARGAGRGALCALPSEAPAARLMCTGLFEAQHLASCEQQREQQQQEQRAAPWGGWTCSLRLSRAGPRASGSSREAGRRARLQGDLGRCLARPWLAGSRCPPVCRMPPAACRLAGGSEANPASGNETAVSRSGAGGALSPAGVRAQPADLAAVPTAGPEGPRPAGASSSGRGSDSFQEGPPSSPAEAPGCGVSWGQRRAAPCPWCPLSVTSGPRPWCRVHGLHAAMPPGQGGCVSTAISSHPRPTPPGLRGLRSSVYCGPKLHLEISSGEDTWALQVPRPRTAAWRVSAVLGLGTDAWLCWQRGRQTEPRPPCPVCREVSSPGPPVRERGAQGGPPVIWAQRPGRGRPGTECGPMRRLLHGES